MFYLYKKTHNKTGLNYLGYTKSNPFDYLGSGTHWVRHISKYGNDVSTEILRECDTKEEVKKFGIYYSKLWNIVDSEEWANLKEETSDGGDVSFSKTWQETRKSEHFRKKQSEGAKGNTNVRGYKWWYNTETKERKRSKDEFLDPWINSFGPATEESKIKVGNALKNRPKSEVHKQNMKKSFVNRKSNTKGTVWVVDDLGNKKRVFPNNIPTGYKRIKNG